MTVNILIAFTTQWFWTRNYNLLVRPLSTEITSSAFSVYISLYSFQKRDFAKLKDVEFTSVLPFGIAAVLSDIFVATALCFLLASNRSDFEDTNLLIHKLIVFAINRCILTSVCQFVTRDVKLSIDTPAQKLR
ncbi:hypothetical protein H0H92_015543 [Tricholoma furcatifolium]|nr:hypothetical protein H0H92_015543 [Tricholoma furcatifolium]